MKTLITMVVLVFCLNSTVLSQAQNNPLNQKRDTVLLTMSSHKWNDSIWGMDNYETYQYTDKDQVILINRYAVSDNGISHVGMKVFEYYKDFDSLKYFKDYFKDGIYFKLNYAYYFYYDDSLRLIKRKYKHNFPGYSFTITCDYFYDAYKLITKYCGEYAKESYYYNVSGQFVGYCNSYSQDSIHWVKEDSANYTYDPNAYILKKEYWEWNDSILLNNNTELFSYTDDYLEMSRTEKIWQDSSLVNSTKETNYYNDEGQIKEKVIQEWKDSIWLNKTKENTEYYDYELLRIKTVVGWQDSIWVNDSKYFYYYGVLGEEGTNENSANASTIELYPNPNQGKFHIEFNDDIKEHSVLLLNLNGSPVYQKNAIKTNMLNIDISDAPKGIYMIRIKNGYKVYTQKVILNN